MQNNQISGTLEQILESMVLACGLSWWGCEIVQEGREQVLRIYIDHEQGVSVDQCALVSHRLSPVLDVEGNVKGAYTLEVSSPGLERPLLKPRHFQQYLGRRVKIWFKALVEARRKLEARLIDADNEMLTLEEGSDVHTISYDSIQKARLAPAGSPVLRSV